MRMDIYVNYRGTCEQAFGCYEQHLGGRITGLVRHGEQLHPSMPSAGPGCCSINPRAAEPQGSTEETDAAPGL